jgi:hypothetical protein
VQTSSKEEESTDELRLLPACFDGIDQNALHCSTINIAGWGVNVNVMHGNRGDTITILPSNRFYCTSIMQNLSMFFIKHLGKSRVQELMNEVILTVPASKKQYIMGIVVGVCGNLHQLHTADSFFNRRV